MGAAPGPAVAAAAMCSAQAAAAGLPLIATAGTCSAIVAVELASPWAARLKGSAAGDAELDAALDRLTSRAKGVRLLFFDGDGRRDPACHRILVFERTPGRFCGFARRTVEAPRESLAAAIDDLVIGTGTAVPAAEQGRDIFVCTHGSRDACCGKLGFPLYRELCERVAAPGIRIWRCSHLGGHRFAPTLLDLPSGRLFGHLSAADAEWLRTLEAGPEIIGRHYRGLCALPSAAQVAERQMWIAHGMAWLDAGLEWICEEAGEAQDVCLTAVWPDGRIAEGSGTLVRSAEQTLVVAESCGRDPERQVPWTLQTWNESVSFA